MNNAKIKLIIPRSVKNKLDDYINLVTTEISGLGDIEKVEHGVFRVTGIYLYKQHCTGGSTSIENTAVHDFIVDRLTEGGSVENVKFWWHSHAAMGVFWSGIDEGAIQNIENDYLISMVQNHKGEFLTRIDLFQPFRTTIKDLEVVIEEDLIVSLPVIPPIEEASLLVPLANMVNDMITIFGEDFAAVSVASFQSEVLAREEFFRKASYYMRSYADIIDNELLDIDLKAIKLRQIPIQAEIDLKVTSRVVGAYSYPYSSSKYGGSKDYSKSFDKGRNKSWSRGMDFFDDDYGFDGMDMLTGFDRKNTSDFKESLDKDDRSDDFKRAIHITKKAENIKSGDWRKMLTMGKGK